MNWQVTHDRLLSADAEEPGGRPADLGGPTGLLDVEDELSLRSEELFNRIAAELDRLTGLIVTVEKALPSLLINRSAPPETHTLAALQQLDLIAQTVAALSGVLRNVVPLRPLDRVLIGAAVRALTLADMSARLGAPPVAATGTIGGGHDPAITGPDVPVNMGDVELF